MYWARTPRRACSASNSRRSEMSASRTTIADLAVLVRSKNAGPFWLTIDVMFDNQEAYRRVRDREAINRAGIAQMYGRDPSEIIVVNHDAALAIKVSFPRPQSSGSKYDSDVYGGQQYGPLLSLPWPGYAPPLHSRRRGSSRPRW